MVGRIGEAFAAYYFGLALNVISSNSLMGANAAKN